MIGDRIKKERTRLGMSQADLAKKVNLSRNAISKIEMGASKNPSSRNLHPIARALGVDPEWLITGKGNKHASLTTGESLSLEESELLQVMRGLTPKQQEFLFNIAKGLKNL